MATRCFLIERTNQIKRSLRRYHSNAWDDAANRSIPECPVHGYHNAVQPLDVITGDRDAYDTGNDEWPHDDPRWPTRCECGYVFQDGDTWQLFTEHLYRRTDTGEVFPLWSAPPGAMYDADWLHGIKGFCGPDGRSMNVILPNGDTWCIDSRASNCNLPNVDHNCWSRHGEPPNLHVDKVGCPCSAGGGSVGSGSYHGFLHNGELT